MSRIFKALSLAALLFASAPVHAVTCGEEECPPGHVCLNRGDGERCWQTCRYDSQCESGCCIVVSAPQTAWICGRPSECGMDLSGGDGGEAAGAICEDERCSSLEKCVSFDEIGLTCAALCEEDSDCESDCCALIDTGEKVCIPEEVECPHKKSGESPGRNGPQCGAQINRPNGWFWGLLLLLVWLMSRGGGRFRRNRL